MSWDCNNLIEKKTKKTIKPIKKNVKQWYQKKINKKKRKKRCQSSIVLQTYNLGH